MKTIYLCGGINGLSDAQCKTWRAIATESLGGRAHTLDPMRRDYRGKEAESVDAIVEGDVHDIEASDYILAMCETPSWGTAMEICLAWSKNIPVIGVCSHERKSPWLLYHCVEIFNTIDEALEYLHGMV